MKRGWFVVVLLAAGPACGDDGSAGTSLDALADRTFVSTSATEDGTRVPLAPGSRLRVSFGADGFVRASAGCNGMGARVRTLANGKLELVDDEGMAMTAMACPGLLEQEGWLGRLLLDEPTVYVEQDRLVLTAGDRRAEFGEHKGDSRRALAGPTWLVESSVAQGEPRASEHRTELVFEDDGRFRARTGCAEAVGRVRYEQGSIVVTNWRAEGCPSPSPVVLETGPFTVDRTGDIVRLRSDRGDGFDLRTSADR